MKKINFDDFINKTLGKKIDVDNYPINQPYQCVDLAKYYNELYFKNFQIKCTKSGYAKDWVELKNTNGILKYYNETTINNMIKGTLVVWGNCKVAPHSHIGFFIEDNKDGTFKCLHQNAPHPFVTISNITYDGLIGAFIPKNLSFEEKNPKELLYKCLGDMYVRWDASPNAGVKLVKDLTKDGQKHATSSSLTSYAAYKKDTIFTVYELVDKGYGLWAKTPSGYVCVKGKSGKEYCEEVK